MVRRIALLALVLTATLCAQDDKTSAKSKAAQQSKPEQQEQQPPEEDEALKPREYAFNPLEAQHDLDIGNYYFKRGNFKAAVSRFREATLWNPGFAEAYLRLGDSEEKLKDRDAANKAYAKYVELSPDGKEAEAIKKKLAGKR